MQLWNTLDRPTLEKHLQEIGHQYITISFYQYAHIADPQAFRNELYLNWTKLDIVGRTYVAKEGINAQIAVPKERRVCLPNTRFLIHQPSGGAGGQATDIAIGEEAIMLMIYYPAYVYAARKPVSTVPYYNGAFLPQGLVRR